MVSVHPLYTEKDLDTDLPLAGKWTDEKAESLVTITQGEKSSYTVSLIENDSASPDRFTVRIVKLDATRFLDATPKETPSLAIAGHYFAKIWMEKETLCVTALKEDWLSEQPDFPAHTDLKSDSPQIILVAPTPDLQAWLKRYAGDSRAFDPDVARLHRVK